MDDLLQSGLRQLGYRHPDVLSRRLLEYGELLIAAGGHTNLVGPRNVEGLVVDHFLDCLALPAAARPRSPAVDVGSGGGLPGIPLALAFPKVSFTLLEPRRRRAEFLAGAVAELGVDNVRVEASSVGAAVERHGRTAAIAYARALAKPPEALRITLPALREGGRAVLYVGRTEVPRGEDLAAAAEAGASLLEASRVVVPYSDT
ncbi:MAG TPA: RsmG family class I SAM-dependent methyltransferase, partial [Candidatus Eremiobacteraceae bacterium]|nr:RsmG family class I SAM-dependent methyltransferase [Candidatus Eremiobacteraceae bacterium]